MAKVVLFHKKCQLANEHYEFVKVQSVSAEGGGVKLHSHSQFTKGQKLHEDGVKIQFVSLLPPCIIGP